MKRLSVVLLSLTLLLGISIPFASPVLAHTPSWDLTTNGPYPDYLYIKIGPQQPAPDVSWLQAVGAILVEKLVATNPTYPGAAVGDVILSCNMYPTWYLLNAHLAFGDELADIPQTKKGNPIPGQFAYDFEDGHATGPTTFVWYNLGPLAGEIYIAFHAVVGVPADGGYEQEQTAWADCHSFSDPVYGTGASNWAKYFHVYCGAAG